MEKKLGASKLTTKNQTTLPKEVRDKLGLSAGDYILYAEGDEDKYVKLRRAEMI